MVLAYGASAHRGLGVPGEEVEGVHAARQLVEWYNGHPHATKASFDLAGCETALIVGGGNVALDCARMLTKSVDELARRDVTETRTLTITPSRTRTLTITLTPTLTLTLTLTLPLTPTLTLTLTLTLALTLTRHDVTDYALAALSRSAVRQVVLLGRRGVLQAAFTIKELRDLTKLHGVACSVEAPADAFNAAVMPAAKTKL